MKRISIRKTYEMEYNQPQDEKMNKYFSRSLEKLIHRIRYQQYCRKEKVIISHGEEQGKKEHLCY
jgi:hypothetical protein